VKKSKLEKRLSFADAVVLHVVVDCWPRLPESVRLKVVQIRF